MMYRAMLHDGISPNDIMIVDLISGFGRTKAIGEGLQIHGTIVKTGFDHCDFIQATIIHFYAACGRIDLACLQFEVGIKGHIASWNALIAGFMRNGMIEAAGQLFNDMPGRDVFSWSAMISGYTQSEQPKMALELFHEMVATGVKPNQITMVSVFSAIASLGTLEEGRWAHEYVCNNSIPLNDNLNAAIIDIAGRLEEAEEMIRNMPMKADVVIWGTLLAASRTHTNVEVGERAAQSLAALDSSHGASRVLLSNIYADAGRWHDAFSIRKEMHSHGLKRLPGCSGVA
ncbi:hypothetical protein Q3G72_003352 [Acer saccharum]|nr:hypothetical protein Q3G72_003352 [Acer saccharum]